MSLASLARQIRRSLAVILLAGLGSFARAQNVNIRYDNILWISSYVAGQTVLIPVPNASVSLCGYPANAVPCTNLATVYYGPTTVGGISPVNPTQTDQLGNFGFWAQPGYYQYTVTNSLGQSAGPFSIVLSSPTSSGGATIPATNFILKGSGSANSALAALPGVDYVTPQGTVANLSGTPLLPTGTAAFTEPPGDSSAALATDAFVLANINNLTAPTTIYSAAGTPLPACVAGIDGAQAVVSDATSPTYLAAYTSGGATVAAVLCNGSSWVTH